MRLCRNHVFNPWKDPASLVKANITPDQKHKADPVNPFSAADLKTSFVKILLLALGKTDEPYLQKGLDIYLNRIPHYLPFEMKIIPDIRNTRKLTEEQQKEKEGALLLQQTTPADEVILLDEKGSVKSSVEFARFLEKKMLAGNKRLIFMIGGPYGFSKDVYERANNQISLSKMTFSHQMVRLLFVEQLYRACTIIKGEPYHHT